MIKLVLTDLDDTLIPYGRPCASETTCDALRAAMEAGMRVGPATGRLPADMEWMFPGAPECCSTGVFANGQVIRADGKTLRTVRTPAPLLERVKELLDSLGGAYLALYEPFRAHSVAYVTARPQALAACPPPSFGAIARVVPCVADFPAYDPVGEDVGSVAAGPAGAASADEPGYVKANIQCACDRRRMAELRDLLNREVAGVDFVFPSLTAPVIDIVPHGWGKGSAALALASALGVSPQEVVVFGDSDNDLDLLSAFPNSVAVENASPAVAAAARWHVGASADGAVDDALLQIARARSTGRMPDFMGGPT